MPQVVPGKGRNNLNKGPEYLERLGPDAQLQNTSFECEEISRNAVYRLKADFDFEAQGDKWRLKAGYEFDGASVPTRAWDLTYEPGSTFVLEAAAKHDIFCEETPEGTDSEVAADDFKADVIRCGGTEEKGEMMRWAIVAFGPKWGPTLDNYLDGTNLPDQEGPD